MEGALGFWLYSIYAGKSVLKVYFTFKQKAKQQQNTTTRILVSILKTK